MRVAVSVFMSAKRKMLAYSSFWILAMDDNILQIIIVSSCFVCDAEMLMRV